MNYRSAAVMSDGLAEAFSSPTLASWPKTATVKLGNS